MSKNPLRGLAPIGPAVAIILSAGTAFAHCNCGPDSNVDGVPEADRWIRDNRDVREAKRECPEGDVAKLEQERGISARLLKYGETVREGESVEPRACRVVFNSGASDQFFKYSVAVPAPTTPAVTPEQSAGKVHYGLDKFDLGPDDLQKIDAYLATLAPGSTIEIFSTADPSETNTYNVSLTQRRNDAVRTYMESKGFKIIEATACGESIARDLGHPDGVTNPADRYTGFVAADGSFLNIGPDGQCTAGQIAGFEQILKSEFISPLNGPK